MANNENTKEQDILKETQEAEQPAPEETAAPEDAAAPTEEPVGEEPAQEPDKTAAALERAKKALAAQEESYLRLAAEYDNFRRRTTKEKSEAYANAKADAALKFLPVYDNLERALKQETADEAYKKGVEMTMTQLKEVLTKLGIEEIPALGEPFDPNLHNAVMHVEDEGAGENTIVDVFQTGFKSGDKVVRFAMVKVAN